LARCRPRWQGWPAAGPAGRTTAGAGVVAAVLVGLTAAAAYTVYGSIGVAVAAARGEPVAVTPAMLDLGLAPAGATVDAVLTLHNLSGKPVQLAYARSDCGCAEVLDLPVTVA
jgi:hypothetical protein